MTKTDNDSLDNTLVYTIYQVLGMVYWSKTTKLILLDSLLQEVCIKSALAGRSPLSSLRLSVCLCQSQTFFIQD